MDKKTPIVSDELIEETSKFLKWGKLITRITAIGATVTGAFSALFSSSSIAGGVALTAAGASTLAATEKLPDDGYVKTKHIPPTVAQRYEQIAKEKSDKVKAVEKVKIDQIKQKLQKKAGKGTPQNIQEAAKPVKKMLASDILSRPERIDTGIQKPRREQHILRTRASYESPQSVNLLFSNIDDSKL